MKSDYTEGGLPSNLELTGNRLLLDRTLVQANSNLIGCRQFYQPIKCIVTLNLRRIRTARCRLDLGVCRRALASAGGRGP